MKPRILLLDLETAPKMAFVWGLYNQNIANTQIIKDYYILCWAAKWLGDDTTYYDALHLHKKAYKKDPTDDSEVVSTLWDMVDEADIIVAHNGDNFDIKVMNARFALNGIEPPSAYRTVDTLKIARRKFKFTSNRLDYLGEILGVGRKLDTSFQLWADIVQKQCPKAFNKMVDYNVQDVALLEDVYLELAPWYEQHPSTVVMGDLDEMRCNVCGSEKIFKNGSWTTQTQTYQKYKCKSCGHNMRSRKADKKDKHQKNNILRSI